MKRPLLLAFAFVFAATAAVAQTPSPPTVEVRARSNTVIDMSTVEVKGTVTGPTIYRLHQRKKVSFRSLIELRGDFRPELSTSTDTL